MTQPQDVPAMYFPATREQVLFGPDGPRPQFLVDSEHLKVVLAGLQPGQRIPGHPEALAVYHFLNGTGTMTVDAVDYPILPGATVVAPNGAARGIVATTQVIFLATKTG